MKLTLKCATLSLALLFLLVPVAANAQCQSITVTTMAFGNYTGGAISTVATITTHCNIGFAYTIGIFPGISGNSSARTMMSGSNALNYGLYKDAAHTNNWGSNNFVDTVNATGTGFNQTFTVYGLTPGGQFPVPGTYTEQPNPYMIAYIYNSGLYLDFPINATVVANCTVSASALAFGTYTGALLDVATTVGATCTNTTTFNIGLNAGTATGATVTTRKMTGPAAATLNYQIFRDGARTVNWGNTVGIDTLLTQGNGTTVNYGVFGRLPAGQAPRPGSYSDTIIVTITY